MNIHDLPNEILNEIFTHIEKKSNDWLSSKLVCKSFQYVGNKVFDPSRNKNEEILWAIENNKVDVYVILLIISSHRSLV